MAASARSISSCPGGCAAKSYINFQVHYVYPEKMIWECEEDHWTGTWDNINEGFDKYQATMAGHLRVGRLQGRRAL